MIENKKIESEFKEKLVAINRITKVVKGGNRRREKKFNKNSIERRQNFTSWC